MILKSYILLSVLFFKSITGFCQVSLEDDWYTKYHGDSIKSIQERFYLAGQLGGEVLKMKAVPPAITRYDYDMYFNKAGLLTIKVMWHPNGIILDSSVYEYDEYGTVISQTRY